MFRSLPLPLVLPARRHPRLRGLAEQLTRAGRLLAQHAAEHAAAKSDREADLADLRHRILSRYY